MWFQSKEDINKEDLELRVYQGDAIEQMMKMEGWSILSRHFLDQLDIYRTDLMLACKDWDEYQEKRAKIHAMNLLMTDVEDFVRQGLEAGEILANHKKE